MASRNDLSDLGGQTFAGGGMNDLADLGGELYQGDPDEMTFRGFAQNVVQSGGKLGADLYSAVRHPLDTLTGLFKLGAGVVEKAVPGEPGAEEALVDAMVAEYKKRYGSFKNFKRTAYEDPVGVLGDISTLLTGVGGVAKGVKLGAQASNLNKVAKAAQTVQKAAGTAGAFVDPINLPLKATGAAVSGGRRAERMYQSALKPSLAKKNVPFIDQEVATGLSAGIPVSKKGVNKLIDLVNDLNDTITDKITSADKGIQLVVNPNPKTGVVPRVPGTPTSAGTVPLTPIQQFIEREAARTGLLAAAQKWAAAKGYPKPTRITDLFDVQLQGAIDPAKVTSRLDDLRQQLLNQTLPHKDIGAVDAARAEFTAYHGQQPLTLTQAQKLKQGTYRELKGKYGPTSTERPAAMKAEMALARGLKEELADAIPEISALNKKESDYLKLLEVLEHAVARHKNRDLVGIGTPIAAGSAAAITGKPSVGAMVGAIKGILEQPSVKSRIAIAINRAQQLNPGKFGTPNMATAIARANAYVNSLEQSLMNGYAEEDSLE